MPRFFNKIRNKLIQQKSPLVKYLLYALGEIVLLVIGILIAVAINNWVQKQQNKDKETFYLEALLKEFEVSHQKLQTLIEVNHQSYTAAQQVAQYMAVDSLPTETELSQLLFTSLSSELTYNPNTSVLEELINSGGLKYISNNELRMHLTSWESVLLGVNRQEENLRKQRERVLNRVLAEHGSIKTVLDQVGVSQEQLGVALSQDPPSNEHLLQSQAVENELLLFILNSVLTEANHYQPLLEEIEGISALIQSELP